jgi:mercuric reductase
MVEETNRPQVKQNEISESVRLLRALRHLDQLLPLKYRQAALPPELVAVHRAILHSFAERGRPLTVADIAVMLGGKNAALRALAVLATNDLVVLNEAAVKDAATHQVAIQDPDKVAIAGAYPFSAVPTGFVVNLFGHDVNAMCGFDSLSIATLFHTETRITAKCKVTGDPIQIRMKEREIIEVSPSRDIRLGVRWQKGAIAAHGL